MKFPQKLWEIVNDKSNNAVQWGPGGKTILVEHKKLQKDYLFSRNSIFKTRNVGSFIRQLNLYGFRKVTSFPRDPPGNIQRPQIYEYLHDSFQANHKELLQHVCRKSNTKRTQKSPNDQCYVHELEKKFPDKISRKSSLQECQTALTKALEQAVSDYRRKKHLKTPNEMELSLQYEEIVMAVLGAKKPKDSEEKSFDEIPSYTENIIYGVPYNYSHVIIPIKENADFQLYFESTL